MDIDTDLETDEDRGRKRERECVCVCVGLLFAQAVPRTNPRLGTLAREADVPAVDFVLLLVLVREPESYVYPGAGFHSDPHD